MFLHTNLYIQTAITPFLGFWFIQYHHKQDQRQEISTQNEPEIAIKC